MPLIKNKLVGNGAVQTLLDIPGSVLWGSLNIVAANKSGDSAPISVHISDNATPADIDLVEPGAVIPGNGRYELSCRLVQGGEKVFVTAPAGVSIRAELNVAPE